MGTEHTEQLLPELGATSTLSRESGASASRAAEAGSGRGAFESWWSAFLCNCGRPDVARDVELANPFGEDVHRAPGGRTRWEQELAKVHEYVSGLEGAVQGHLHTYHRKIQDALNAQEKRHAEELLEMRIHILTLASSVDKSQVELQNELKENEKNTEEVHELRRRIAQEVDDMQGRSGAVSQILSDEVGNLKLRMVDSNQDMDALSANVDEIKRDMVKLTGECQKACSCDEEYSRLKELTIEMRARAVLLPTSEAEVEKLKKQYQDYVEGKSSQSARVRTQSLPGVGNPSDPKVLANRAESIQQKHEARAADELATKQALLMAALKKEVAVERAEVDSLRVQTSALHKCFEELREDLHKEIEVTSIKAGYLSVALTGCDEPERRRIKEMLRKREEELTKGGSGLVLYSTAMNNHGLDAFGATIEKEVVAYEVDVSTKDGKDLGVVYDNEGSFLTIRGIKKDSLISQYNAACLPPQVPVGVGDHIVQVNNVKAYGLLLEQELKGRKHLKIYFERVI